MEPRPVQRHARSEGLPGHAARRRARVPHVVLSGTPRPADARRARPYHRGVATHLLAADVTSNVYLLTAFGAGVISFLSPCVLPIVPGYLSLITGLSVGEIRDANLQTHYLQAHRVLHRAVRRRLHRGVRAARAHHHRGRQRARSATRRRSPASPAGSCCSWRCYLAGTQILTTPRLYQEFRWHPHLERFGPVAAPVAGAAFGLGWTPCIGPVLGAVLGFAAGGQDIGRAVAAARRLLDRPRRSRSCAVGLAMGKLTRALDWFKRHSRAITLVSAGDPRGARDHPAHRPALRGHRAHVELPARPSASAGSSTSADCRRRMSELTVRPRLDEDLDAVERIARVVHTTDGYPLYLPDGDLRGFVASADAHVGVGGDSGRRHRRARGAARVVVRPGDGARNVGDRGAGDAVRGRRAAARGSRSRREGIARRLLDAAVSDARARDRVPILDVMRAHRSAIALYESCGWQLLGVVTVRLPTGPAEELVYLAPLAP